MTRNTAEPAFTRMALLPGLLGAIVLLAGLALIGGEWFLLVRYAVSILALIMCVFTVQAKSWGWLALLVPIAVLWNPVMPIAIDDLPLRLLHILAAAGFVVAGLLVKTPLDRSR